MLSSGQFSSPLQGASPFRKRAHEAGDARVDMTAMVDLVFMMNIFFLVTTLVTALAEIDLPAAKHVVAADLETSVVFTVVAVGVDGRQVYLGDGTSGEPLAESGQDERIAAAVQEGVRRGKTGVVVKAERNLALRHIASVAAAATSQENVSFYVAVLEKD